MQTKTTSIKIDCVNIVKKLNSPNVISDATKLYKYLSKGGLAVKIESIYMIIDNERRPTSLDALIKELEEVYDFVINSL